MILFLIRASLANSRIRRRLIDKRLAFECATACSDRLRGIV